MAGLGMALSGLAATATVTACGRAAAAAMPATPAVGGQTSGTLLWRSRATPPIDDEPRVLSAAGLVYATGGGRDYGDSGIYAFAAGTGRELWRTPGTSGPRPGAAGPSAVFGFTVTPEGRTEVVATSAATGRTIWTDDVGRLLDNAKVGWMAYAAGLVYVAAGETDNNTTGQPTVRALDARTGHRIWEADAGAAPQMPAVANGVVYTSTATSISATSGAVLALDATTGRRLWRSADIGGSPFGVVVTGSVVVVTVLLPPSLRSVSIGMDAKTGRRLWRKAFPAAALAGTGNMVFCFTLNVGPSMSCTVQARHAPTGAIAWKRTFPGQPALTAARGVFYLGAGDGTLRALGAATGRPLWTYKLAAPAADITTGNHAIYVLDEHGAVYAIRA